MLQTQVNYWTLQENKRHNIMSETLGFLEFGETQRHNQETEKLGWSNLQETKRHNIATENLGWAGFSETGRHNRITEGQGQQSIYESIRTHMANEAIGRTQAGAAALQAKTAAGRLELDTIYRPQEVSIAQENADANRLKSLNDSAGTTTNQQRAQTESINAQTQRDMTDSNIYKNEQEVKRGWFDSISNAYESHKRTENQALSNILKVVPFLGE